MISTENPFRLTGAGCSVVERLAAEIGPGARMIDALDEIFNAAKAKAIGVLVDAEQHYVQNGIDAWTLQAQERYNHGKAVIYSTCQAYLQSAPATLARHLAFAKEKGFVLGVKLVRGAYLGADPRHIIWSSKAETDRAYDGIAEALIRSKYNHILTPVCPAGAQKRGNSKPRFPETNFVLATHNHVSVRKAIRIWKEERRNRKNQTEMAFGQLMGMADEVSCELTTTGREEGDGHLKTYKYLPWGTVRECLGYMTRRADENRQAVERAREGRKALHVELKRRALRGLSWS